MERFAANIFENREGEPVIALEALSGEPDMPSLVLKKGTEAVFYRTADQFIGIENMDLRMQERLRSAQKILVAEIDVNGETNGYYADVKELN